MKVNKTIVFRCTVLLFAIAFIIIGLINGEHMDVMRKAIRVCLECIGIG